ncbi:MAG: cell division protein ZapA [Anderseniella sp.]|jgi:cell division protein ZapA|nr:cell division protein ZapA [Anderseniella sp.]
MGQVVITVNNRNFTMECADGEEGHLKDLASLLDSQVKEIKAGVGEVGDIRLLVMAGLIIADQLSEALDKVETLSSEIAGVHKTGSDAIEQSKQMERSAAERIEAAAKRLEQISRLARQG